MTSRDRHLKKARPAFDHEVIEALRVDLLVFFTRAPEFPWRLDRDPYRILVSEVMLQQTRAGTVVPYFRRWMERFPNVASLAAASEQEVLRVWQGLGYYSRARNLLSAAREIEDRFGGKIPDDPAMLESLPGVGPYTAGAVASIAFGVAVPAVDGNVRRVLARLTDHPAPSAGVLKAWATQLVDPVDPGSFNQALMELGARVCTPARPKCTACPASGICRSREAGTQEERPQPRTRKPIPSFTEVLAVIVYERESRRKVLLRRRPTNGLLGGMWEFPGAPVRGAERPEATAARTATDLISGSCRPKPAKAALDAASPNREIELEPDGALETVQHDFTHRRMRYLPFVFSVSSSVEASGSGEGIRWVDSSEADNLPIAAAQLKVLRRIL